MGHKIIGSLIELHKSFNMKQGLPELNMPDNMIFDLLSGEVPKKFESDKEAELENDMKNSLYNPALFVEVRWLKYILRNSQEDNRLSTNIAYDYFEKEKYDSLDAVESKWGKEKDILYKVFAKTFGGKPNGELNNNFFTAYCLGVEQCAPIITKHVLYRLKK